MNDANYRKYNDRSLSSSTYHKKDGTSVRSKLKKEKEDEIKNYFKSTNRDNHAKKEKTD